MKTTLDVAPADRSYSLRYYHANKELMNLQSYINKVNRNGNSPLFAYRKAFQLFQDESGKWCFPDCIKQEMKDRAAARVAAEAAQAQAQAQPPPPQAPPTPAQPQEAQ